MRPSISIVRSEVRGDGEYSDKSNKIEDDERKRRRVVQGSDSRRQMQSRGDRGEARGV